MPSLVGKGNARDRAAVDKNQFIAQLYINRRKVWEGRANSEEEAARMAKHEKSKYPGTKSTTVIKQSGVDGYE